MRPALRRHAALPQAVLLVLAGLFGALWIGAVSTGVAWVAGAPYLVLAGVFLCGALVVWGVRRVVAAPAADEEE